LTLATTAPSAAFRLPDRPRWFLPGAGLLLIAWILLLLAAGKHRRVKLAFGLLVFAMLATAFVACGGGGGSTGPGQGNPGTPTGSYTITVTGTSTVSGASVSHTLNIPVSVQ
jgi:peptidoglycan/LPS O-acetylase OafA/YrhL